MSDPRTTPNPTLVSSHSPARVTQPVADLCRTPDGARDRQVIYGDVVTVLHDANGWSYVQATKDGYCGHMQSGALGPSQEATHAVSVPATHVYAQPDFKSQDRFSLSHASRVRVTERTEKFAATSAGYIPLIHLAALGKPQSDPAEVAALYLGTPYLWGGNSRWGIDCSGLVQAALLGCAIPCPGDSDMQETLGVEATGGYQRNDLLFWKGHVALVCDAQTLIHANAAHMATVLEPIEVALKRIEQQGDGRPTAHRRIIQSLR